jgi:hypothetical protein
MGRFYALSTLAHLFCLVLIATLAGKFTLERREPGIVFNTELPPEHKVVIPPIDPTKRPPLDLKRLDADVLAALEGERQAQTAKYFDDRPGFLDEGGGLHSDAKKDLLGGLGFKSNAYAIGPLLNGLGGVGNSVGASTRPGNGGAGDGIGLEGRGSRRAILGDGKTFATLRAADAALDWIARHQNPNGSWSLDGFDHQCTGKKCTSPAARGSDSAATALALLPFLAAGETPVTDGPHKKTVSRGLQYLINNQQADGSLAGRSAFDLMYTHGLATIALCEAYGMTRDSRTGSAAQRAIQFIEQAQDPTGGGWRYTPGQPGDTSVTGWQIMALKSAEMARLKVDPEAMQAARKFLLSVAVGSAGSEFSYLQGDQPKPTMTSVGLLCLQYLGAQRRDAAVQKGVEYLLRHPPVQIQPDCYYWYYATQVMHNVQGPEWDTWNRQMRRVLVETQQTKGCAAGSWDPNVPDQDPWGRIGGRLMQTSLCCLTLEIYYRYMPLYNLDGKPLAESPDAQAALELPPDLGQPKKE